MTKAMAGPTVTLPQVAASPVLADRIVDSWPDLRSRDVVVDSYQVVRTSASFADRLIVRVLRDGHALSMTVRGGPAQFHVDLLDSAARLQADDRLRIDPD